MPIRPSAYQRWILLLGFLLLSRSLRAEATTAVRIPHFTEPEISRVLKGVILTCAHLKGKADFSNTPQLITLPDMQRFGIDTDQYEMIAVEKAFFPFKMSKNAMDSLVQHLSCFNCLRGLKYYSKNDKRIQTLITECNAIDPPEAETSLHLAQPRTDSMLTHYFEMRDNRLGKNRFRCDILMSGTDIFVHNSSLDGMSKFIFHINDVSGYQMFYLFQYDGIAGGYFYTAIQLLQIKNAFLLKLGMLNPGNFANRIRAITVYIASYFGLNWQKELIASK
jgi:hypothetical protein